VGAAAKEHFFHADGNVLKMANSSASLPISWYIHQPTLIEAIQPRLVHATYMAKKRHVHAPFFLFCFCERSLLILQSICCTVCGTVSNSHVSFSLYDHL
jgi:hypothetical protein